MPEKEKKSDEDVEIQRLFKDFKRQITNLKTKKTNLENTLRKIKTDLHTLQEEEFKALSHLQKLIQDGIELSNKRAKAEAELNDIKEKLLKLTKITV